MHSLPRIPFKWSGWSISYLACILLSIYSAAYAQTPTWVKQYDSSSSEGGVKVKADVAGNVYVVAVSNDDIVTIKYNAVGLQQWAVRYDSVFTNAQGTSLHTQDRGTDLLVDAAGNAYVTGVSYFEGNCKQVVVTTLKYNASGVRQWKVNTAATSSCTLLSYTGDPGLAMDGAGDLYLAATYQAPTNPTSETILQKLTPLGNQVWRKAIDNATLAGTLYLAGFDVDAAGNAVIGINTFPPDTSRLLVKYNSAGNVQWQRQVPVGSIKIDTSGNIYVGGGVLTKYNAAGQQLWQSAPSEPGVYNMMVDNMLVDASGNVYGIGSRTDGDNCVYTSAYAFKFNAQGMQQWTNYFIAFPGCGYANVYINIALDEAQNLYVLASYENDDGKQFALNTISPANVTLWRSFYTQLSTNPYSYDLLASSLDVDAVGNIYVTGSIAPTPANGDVLTLKYDSQTLCRATGLLSREVWTNVPGKLVSAIPVNTPANVADSLANFNTPAGYGDNYGQRIRGYLCPPVSGAYTFFLQGDDQAELYLSSDNTPANKGKIITVQGAQSWVAQPTPVSLVAGHRYYVEALHKENTGGDFIRVGWRTPAMAANATPVIVPGSALSPYPNPTLAPTLLYAATTKYDFGSYYVALRWGVSETATGYVVERATAPQGPFVKIGNSSYDYVDGDVQMGTTYYYRIYATSAEGASAYSNVVSALVPLPTCTPTGTLYREYWAGSFGSDIIDVPVNTPPTLTDQLTSFRTRANVADNYGQRLRGYFCVPVTGTYTFFIQGDDEAVLYLSTDDNPANKKRIASAHLAWEWTQSATQQSAAVSLVVGQSYYVEVLHKEGSGGDMVRVGWRTPSMASNAEPLIIPGSVLSPFVASANGLAARWVDEGEPVAEPSFSRLKAYPNPTTGSTVVEFTAEEAGWLNVDLYNLQGQPLRQLFGQPVEAGSTHQRLLDTGSLPAGLYLLRLVNGQQVHQHKLLVIH